MVVRFVQRYVCMGPSDIYVNRLFHASACTQVCRCAVRQDGSVGFTDDIIVGGRHDGIVVEYDKGTSLLPQPSWMNRLPMSLWNVALEAHSGRLFIGNIATYVFVLVMGMAAVWSLITGLKIRRKPKKNSKRK